MPNLGAVVTLFDVDGLLLFLMMFYHKSVVRSSYMIIFMFIICYITPCGKFIRSGDTFWAFGNRCQVVPSGTRWYQVVLGGTWWYRWFQVVSGGTR